MTVPLAGLHVSNALKYASVAAAMGAIPAATGGAPGGIGAAGALLATAALGDTVDGRFARLVARTPRQRASGRELDSLADVVVFGVTPVVVVHAASGGAATAVWWVAAFVDLVAAMTRLAHFNVDDDPGRFVGVPTPAIALVWSTALLWPVPASAGPVLFLGCAVAMVAPVTIPRPQAAGLALFAAWAAALVLGHLA
jgi:CDP-diacylglycerol--serine O-phosphatidyltransferase